MSITAENIRAEKGTKVYAKGRAGVIDGCDGRDIPRFYAVAHDAGRVVERYAARDIEFF